MTDDNTWGDVSTWAITVPTQDRCRNWEKRSGQTSICGQAKSTTKHMPRNKHKEDFVEHLSQSNLVKDLWGSFNCSWSGKASWNRCLQFFKMVKQRLCWSKKQHQKYLVSWNTSCGYETYLKSTLIFQANVLLKCSLNLQLGWIHATIVTVLGLHCFKWAKHSYNCWFS